MTRSLDIHILWGLYMHVLWPFYNYHAGLMLDESQREALGKDVSFRFVSFSILACVSLRIDEFANLLVSFDYT